MQMQALCLLIVLALSGVAATGLPQEGHPLVGSWHGSWGPTVTDRMDLTVIMDWDGVAITGIVNPVSDRAPLQNAKLDPGNWTVHFEADIKDNSGVTVRCVANGTLDRLGSDRRTLAGAWTCGSTQGDFHLTRARDY